MRKLLFILSLFTFLSYAPSCPASTLNDYVWGSRFARDFDILDATPHLGFKDTDSNVGYMFHLDSGVGAAPYQNFQLWRGTYSGSAFSVNPDIPLIWWDNNNDVHFYDDVTLRGVLKADTITSQAGTAPNFSAGLTATTDLIALHPCATITVASSTSRGKNAADYVCDGTADDVQIQAAVNALPAIGGHIKLLEGTYSISTSIVVDKAGVWIEGSGVDATTLTLANNANCDVFSLVTTAKRVFFKLSELTINGNKANNASGRGVYNGAGETGVWDVYIDHVFFIYMPGVAIHLNQGWGAIISNTIIEFGASDGIYITGGNDPKIFNCKIIGNAGTAIYITGSYKAKILSCLLDAGVNKYAIRIGATSAYNIVEGNSIFDNDNAGNIGIYIEGDVNSIMDNVIYVDSVTPAMVYGIQLVAGANKNFLMNNLIWMAGTGTAFADAGSNNISTYRTSGSSLSQNGTQYTTGNFNVIGEGSFTERLTFGTSTGVGATAAAGVLTLAGIGNTNNENLTLDFESVANRVALGTGTGVTHLMYNLSYLLIPDARGIVFGAGLIGRIGSTATGNDNLQLGLAVNSVGSSGYFNIIEYGDIGVANRSPLALASDPTLRIYSSDATIATPYIEFYHDNTNATIATGLGDIILAPAGNDVILDNAKLDIQMNSASTATVEEKLRLTHTSTGTVAAGFGGSLDTYLEDASGNAAQQATRIAGIWTTPTHLSESSALTFSTVNAGGAITESARVIPTGITLGGTAGVSATAAAGVLTLGGIGNTNNESLALDFETSSNIASITTTTGVTSISTTTGLNIGANNIGGKLNVSLSGTGAIFAVNTAASSSGGGAGIVGYADDGAALAAGDRLGFFLLGGVYDTSHTFVNAAGMQGLTSEAWSSTNQGAYLAFVTTPTGSTTGSRAERVRINQGGNVGIGTTDDDGTPATGRFVVKGSTADGSTNAQVWRDSNEVNVAVMGTNGNLTVAGKLASTATSVTIAAAATTFAITSNVVTVTGDAGANTVATITGGVSGQTLTLLFVDALVTITDDATGNANTVNLSGAFVSTANDTMTLVFNGTSWRETCRSVN